MLQCTAVSGQLVDSSLFQNLWETKFRAAIFFCLFCQTLLTHVHWTKGQQQIENKCCFFCKSLFQCRCNSVEKVFTGTGSVLTFLTVSKVHFVYMEHTWTFNEWYPRGIWLRVGGGTPLKLRLFCPHPPHPWQNNNLVQLQLLRQPLQSASISVELMIELYVLCCQLLDNSTCVIQWSRRFWRRFFNLCYWEILNSDFFALQAAKEHLVICGTVFFSLTFLQRAWLDQWSWWLSLQPIWHTGFIDPPCHRWKRAAVCSSIVSSDGTFVDAFLFTAEFAFRVSTGSVWHFPRHPWFSLAFIPLVCGVYTWGWDMSR